MKLRFFLFLVLFFNSFSVFAVSQVQATLACQSSLVPNSCDSCLRDTGGSQVVFSIYSNSWNGSIYTGLCSAFPFDNSIDTCTPPTVWISSLNRCGTPSETCTDGNKWCSSFSDNQQTVTGQCVSNSAICTPPPDCSLHLNTVLNSAGSACVLKSAKDCTPPLVNDPNNNQNCIPPTAVVCTSPKVRDSDLTSPTFNTCIDPPPKQCSTGQINDPANNQNCIPVPRPTYCGPAFTWDGVSCSMGSSKSKVDTPAPPPPSPDPQNSAPSPSPPTETKTDIQTNVSAGGVLTTTTTTTNPDGSKSTTTTTANQAGSSANIQGQGVCNSGDSCDQSAIKKNTADTAKNTADTVAAINKLDADLTKQSTVTGSQYTKTGKTMSGVFSDFKGRMSNSPLISTASGFFTLNSSGGTCPTWSDIVMGISIVIDAQCGPLMTGTVFPMLRGAFLFVAAFMAFRFAFL